MQKAKWMIPLLLGLFILIIWMADNRIQSATRTLVFNDVNTIPHNKVGLLLGTSRYLKSGTINQYFTNRITAAVALFNSGKIDFIVISRDNSKEDYNEPLDKKNELMKPGVPEDKIFLVYAGFRTYDSVIRIDKIFGQQRLTLISREFHNRRAKYISKSLNLKAIGFKAKDVEVYNRFKTKVREKFARVKVFIDILFNKKPKFLGQPIEIKQ